MKRRMVSVLMIVTMFVALIVPLSSLAEDVTIRLCTMFLEDEPTGKAFYAALDQYEKDHPGVKFVVEIVNDQDLKTKIKTEAAGESLPDIFEYWSGGANGQWLYSAAMTVPFETLVSEIDALSLDLFKPDDLEQIKYKDIIYGIPFTGAYSNMIYNLDLYKKAGLKNPLEYDVYTWEQMRADAEVFKEMGIFTLATTAQGANPMHQWFSAIQMQVEGGKEAATGFADSLTNPCKPDGNGSFAAAMQIIQDDITAGLYPTDMFSGQWPLMYSLFAEEKAACMWNLSSWIGQLPDEIGEHCAIGPVPQVTGSVIPYDEWCLFSPDQSLYVSNTAWEDPAKKAAIIEFFNWFFTKETLQPFMNYYILTAQFPFADYSNTGLMLQAQIEFAKDPKRVNWRYMSNSIYDSATYNNYKAIMEEAITFQLTPQEYEIKTYEMFQEYIDELDE